MLGEILPRNVKTPFEVVNKLMTKREISSTIDQVYPLIRCIRRPYLDLNRAQSRSTNPLSSVSRCWSSARPPSRSTRR